MRLMVKSSIILASMMAAPLALAFGAPVIPQDELAPAQQAVSRDDQVQLNLLNKIDMLEQQVRQLRGELEEQAYRVKQLESIQRNLYSDLDQRLNGLSQGNAAPVANNQPITNSNDFATGQAATQDAPDQAAVSQSQADDVLKEQRAYEQAYSAIGSKDYMRAATLLQDYLRQYPQGQYAVNAHYWLGELNLIAGNSQQAESEFNTVVNQYASSSKVADAKLKLGFIYYDQGQWQKAKETLNQVKRDYPDSTAANLAGQRLAAMSREGH